MKKAFRLIVILFLWMLNLSGYSFGLKEVKGSWFLLDNLRLFNEINLIQEKWTEIDNTLNEIEPNDMKFDWKDINEKAAKLADEAFKMFKHFGEDIKKVEKKLSDNQLKKIIPFLEQALIYADVVLLAITKRAKIINRLYRMTYDPESWTAKEHLEEMKKYQKLLNDYDKEGIKLNTEFEKTQEITIQY